MNRDMKKRALRAPETTKIDGNTLRRVAGMMGKEEGEIRDALVKGLSIRVRAASATWALRGRLGPEQKTLRVGDALATARNETGIDEIRDRARDAKKLLSRGIDPTSWLKEQERGGKAERSFDPSKDGMTWKQARDAFLQHIKAVRSPHTHADYRKTLTCPAMRNAKWDDRLLKSITKAEVRLLRDAIAKEGKVPQANHVLRVTKSLMSWAVHQEGTGITDQPSVAADVKATEHKVAKGHVPTADELGRLWWKLDDMRVAPAARLAAALIVFTAQRRETVASARTADFTQDPDRPGWGVWRMDADPQLLRDRPHAVPLPPVVWGVVQASRSLAGHSPWLYPQMRPRARSAKCDGHLSGKTIYDVIVGALPGVSPHDMRRALGTHGPKELKLKDADTRLILHHAEGNSGDVTTLHYAFHESIPDKVMVMRAWTNWLTMLMRQQAPAGRDWPAFLPRAVDEQSALQAAIGRLPMVA